MTLYKIEACSKVRSSTLADILYKKTPGMKVKHIAGNDSLGSHVFEDGVMFVLKYWQITPRKINSFNIYFWKSGNFQEKLDCLNDDEIM